MRILRSAMLLSVFARKLGAVLHWLRFSIAAESAAGVSRIDDTAPIKFFRRFKFAIATRN